MELLPRVVPTGCSSLDKLLEGGFPTEEISLIYGEAETGKTSLAIQCAVNVARQGYKAIYLDSDGTFSPTRLSQITHYDSANLLSQIFLARPTAFQEQAFAIDHFDRYITKKVGLFVVDTVTSLYRAELGSPKETFILNRELNRQVASLAQIAKTYGIAIILTSQVRSVFVQEGVSIEPVATRVLNFWSDIVLNLKHTSQKGVVNAVIEKHPKRKRSMSCYLKIGRTGIRDYGR